MAFNCLYYDFDYFEMYENEYIISFQKTHVWLFYVYDKQSHAQDKKVQGLLELESEEKNQKEGERGDLGEYRYSYILLVLLCGGGGSGVTRVEGVDRVKEDGQWDAPPNSASWA